ncbi:MAG TPA: hypothetical protein VFE88_04345 [Candidatus Nanoarchaeia archaeon]|nr:hypothetical protein [Candidatus Nanoarchaeia archaeon]
MVKRGAMSFPLKMIIEIILLLLLAVVVYQVFVKVIGGVLR